MDKERMEGIKHYECCRMQTFKRARKDNKKRM